MAAESLWKLGGLSWTELGKRVYNEILEDDVFGSSAQLAYYFLFALFPLLIFLTSIFGFIVGADSELRDSLFQYLGAVLPGSATGIVASVIQEVTQASGGGKLTIGLFLALWAASSGLVAVTSTLNRAYTLEETRSWWKLRLVALGLTIALAVSIISALVVIIFGNHIIDYVAASFGFGDVFRTIWKIAQWLIVLAFVLLAFALIYYFAPDVEDQRWFWVTPGSIVGVAIWILVSFGFRIYLQYFDSYSATYGSLGAVIILLLWLYFTGAAILIGGEINSEIENAAAKAGAPDAKEEGQKAPDSAKDRQPENLKAENKNEKKANAPVYASENAAQDKTEETKKVEAQVVTTESLAPPKEKRNLLTKIAAVGNMIAGIFMTFRNKNEKH